MTIGEYNDLSIARVVDFGLYLTDDTGEEVLLPKRYVTAGMTPGQHIKVFVYLDSEGRPVATTEKPFATRGDIALLRVKAVNAVGAFLDWGLTAKDLLVPFREQRVKMLAGRSYVVKVYLDESSGRIVASAKLGRFVGKTAPRYYHRQRVDLIVAQRTELGYRVVVNNEHWGMIYQKELYQDVNIGDRCTGFVQKVREDGKVDVTLSKIEKLRIDDLSARILQHLKDNGGTMTLNDKSAPEDIFTQFGCSKKDFKKSLGLLYRQRLVTLGEQIILTPDTEDQNDQWCKPNAIELASIAEVQPIDAEKTHQND